MGVAGAFVFAAQMINFSIPGTGSSGHIGGGLLLAVLLGPYAAFLVMASVLGVQALFFADGGLLALGANSFNLGFFPAFIAFPLVYRPIVGKRPTGRRIVIGSVLGAVVGLLLGAIGGRAADHRIRHRGAAVQRVHADDDADSSRDRDRRGASSPPA
jgi:cobalt/nickel transport system permease protein